MCSYRARIFTRTMIPIFVKQHKLKSMGKEEEEEEEEEEDKREEGRRGREGRRGGGEEEGGRKLEVT